MNTAPEIPYTDRDVREDPMLADLAVEYLHQYGGSYEPLVNAQQMLRSDGSLTTQITRVVLNCMRHDTNVARELPPPKRYLMSVPNVAELASRQGRRNSQDIIIVRCSNTKPHSVHYVNPTNKCNGIPHLINRHPTEMRVTVKTPYARARTGKLWHHVDTSRNASYAMWYPPSHEYGWPDRHAYAENIADLYVKTICKYPSILKNPILMKTAPSRDAEEHLLLVTECPWCVDMLEVPVELR